MKPPLHQGFFIEKVDKEKRIVAVYGSCEVVDSDGEIIPIDDIEKSMPILMKRGGIVMHENFIVFNKVDNIAIAI